MTSAVQDNPHALTDPLRRALVEETLETILADDAFRTSRQSEKLLRYLVTHSLDGHDELLREKQVGVGVFGRESGYDTTSDPIVRVRANEIRKRLARYYESVGMEQAVRLEVPPGSYRVNFLFAAPEQYLESDNDTTLIGANDGSATTTPPIRPTRRQLLALAGTTLAAVGGLGMWRKFRPTALERFWDSAVQISGPVILCAGHPVVYRFSKRFLQRNGTPTADYLAYQTMPFAVQPDQVLRGEDIVAIPNQYIGIGSAFAAARVSSLMAKRGKEVELRFGNDISFTDLKRSPTVLIGAFSNRWTLELCRSGRLEFITEEGFPGLRDRQSGKRWFAKNLKEDGSTDEDFILIKRLVHSETGKFAVLLAGLTQYGCQAAADLVTTAEPMQQLTETLPANWQEKNIEFLMHVPVFRGSPGTPKLLMHHEW